ncbi:hypothetical protein [Paenibacillus chitinolyticus]|uniref:hypothetical protein n=1 Tax=Paenibacillus chitinolyticus TaxID=79263 RepID=UPI001C44F50E|nr:hypothetical protein [Paenibacillus chitinolyticus]MBV6716552.1 hypothetical protein [Paenibacillus chitinolyticus]
MDDALKNVIMETNKKQLTNRFNEMLQVGHVKKNIIEKLYEQRSLLLESSGKTNKEMTTAIFNEAPLQIIHYFIPYLVFKEMEYEADPLLDTENYREKIEFPFTFSLRANEFNVITNVQSPSLELYSDDNDVTSYVNFKVELDRFNHLSKEIFLKGTFVQDESVSHNAFDYLDKKITLYITGLLKNDPIPSWVEYLIEGCINIEYENDKMALFNIFASLDKFIELLNETIFDYYVVSYKGLIKKFAITTEDKVDISEFLKSKIKKFGRDNRRIIEKLRDALKEIGINGENDQFKKTYSLIKEIEKIEETRNKIGHGEKVVQEINVGQVLQTILTLVFAVITFDDVEQNDWGNIIT